MLKFNKRILWLTVSMPVRGEGIDPKCAFMCDQGAWLPTLNAGDQIPVNRPFSRVFMMQNWGNNPKFTTNMGFPCVHGKFHTLFHVFLVAHVTIWTNLSPPPPWIPQPYLWLSIDSFIISVTCINAKVVELFWRKPNWFWNKIQLYSLLCINFSMILSNIDNKEIGQ